MDKGGPWPPQPKLGHTTQILRMRLMGKGPPLQDKQHTPYHSIMHAIVRLHQRGFPSSWSSPESLELEDMALLKRFSSPSF